MRVQDDCNIELDAVSVRNSAVGYSGRLAVG